MYTSMTDYLNGFKRMFVLDNASTPVVISATDRLSLLNEARDEIAMELMCVPTTATKQSTVGTRTYTLSSFNTYLTYVDAVYYGSKELIAMRTRKEYYFSTFLTTNAEPDYYYIDEQVKNLKLMPPPDKATKLTIFGYSIPATLSATGSESAIPYLARRAVVPYALWRAYERDDLHEANQETAIKSAISWKSKYEQEIARAKARLMKNQYRGKGAQMKPAGYEAQDIKSYT